MNKNTFQKIWQFCHPSSREREQTIVLITSVCVLITLVLSHNLWFRNERILLPSPILPFTLLLPLWTDWLLYGSVIVSIMVFAIEPKYKSSLLVFPIVFIVWVLQDSLRWQPFLYMYDFAFLAVFLNRNNQNRLLPVQIMVIGVYFWAGIGKLNPYFHELVFPWFVDSWIKDNHLAVLISYLVPVFEFSIGIFLLIPRLRNSGLILASGMLLVVLICLGPLGRNWGWIVLPWNIFLFITACCCFISKEKQSLFKVEELKKPVSVLAVILFWILPLAGQFGYWGAHPSFKLYSGDLAVGYITLDPQEDAEKLPGPISTAVSENQVDLILWSVDEFMVAPTPSVPGYGSYLTAAKGLCRYLQYPDAAYLVITKPKLPSEAVGEPISKVKLCL